MSSAVSRELEFPVERARRSRTEASPAGTGASDEKLLVLRPVPMADVAVPTESITVMPRERSEALSRAVNCVVAALAIVLLLPVIALIAAVIKLTSRGPVLYSQIRVGVDRRFRSSDVFDRRVHDFGGRLFRMYKFRTMRADAESDGREVWAQKNDPRTTSIGRVLRATRLDELPQLYNVLRGDMNIVGPRPERPSIFHELRANIPEYPLRQRVKPGITGWAQVNHSYDACVDDVRRKIHYDLEYLQRQCMIEDLRIMSMTLPVMFFRKGGW